MQLIDCGRFDTFVDRKTPPKKITPQLIDCGRFDTFVDRKPPPQKNYSCDFFIVVLFLFRLFVFVMLTLDSLVFRYKETNARSPWCPRGVQNELTPQLPLTNESCWFHRDASYVTYVCCVSVRTGASSAPHMSLACRPSAITPAHEKRNVAVFAGGYAIRNRSALSA
ncbi:hypothetical protein F2P81_012256 [Scophthalmus maximus]|uniref:Uncharacterized protein n=1 Tax=Scophthalmus maximus TaxID=52904 RepID=A0A6A4SQW2_SCOMX|nr:hypothetical protein F2P81_012256 [Scophthalmus maximus]